MYSRLRKLSVFLLTMVLLLSFTASASATVRYETVTSPRVRHGGVRELGSVLVRIQPLLDINHAAWVSPPSDFTIERVRVTRASYNGQDLDFEIDGVAGPAPVTAEPFDDGFLLSIPAQGEINEEVLVILSFERVDVPQGYRGDIIVNFEGLHGQFTSGKAGTALVPGRPEEDPDEVEEPAEPEEPELPEEVEEPEEPEPLDRRASEVFMEIGSTTVRVDGEEQEMELAPFIQDGHTFVPVRFLAEAFNARADWGPKDGPVQVVTLTREDIEITVYIGGYYIYVREARDVSAFRSDAAALIREGRTFLPFRAIAEAFRADVDYDVDADGRATSVWFTQ